MKISDHLYLVGSDQFGLSHPLDCNCYVIDTGDGLVVVDPGRGFGLDDIQRNMERDGLRPDDVRCVLVTHHHDGHTGACREVRDRWSSEIWAPVGAVDLLRSGLDAGIPHNARRGYYPTGWSFPTFEPDRAVSDGERHSFGRGTLEAIQVRGHTPDSTCYLWEDGGGLRVLLTGDALFYFGRLGLINLPGCSLADYREDIDKLRGLGVDALLPGHGVFSLARGQWHLDRAANSLRSIELPESFFETTEFTAHPGPPASADLGTE